MPAPDNDLLANAVIIPSALSGTLSSSNTGATTESGEPGWPLTAMSGGHAGTPYATVWYSWTVPTIPAPTGGPGPGYYDAPSQAEFLLTNNNPVTGSFTNFKSTVQVFTSDVSGTPTMSSLSEVAVNLDERVGCNCGLANGARLSFIAIVGTTYYIRIGGRNNAQGNFNMDWGAFDMMTLGSCANCGPTTAGPQIGEYQLPITVGGTQSFTLTPGAYQVSYCKGAFIWVPDEPYWVIATGAGGFGVTSITLPDGTVEDVPDGGNASAAATRLAYECYAVPSPPFVTCGGTLTFTFNDTDYTDNIAPGTTPPIFQVKAIGEFPSPYITPYIGGSEVSWTGSACSAQFQWENSGYSIPGTILTATLLNTGGVSGASAPVSGLVAIPGAGGPNNVNFTFTAPITSEFCTATVVLTLTACPSTVVATLEFPLYPILTYSFDFPTATHTCSGTNTWAAGLLSVVSSGIPSLGSDLQPTCLCTSTVVPIVNESCVVQPSGDTFTIGFGESGTVGFIYLQGQTTATATELKVVTTWGTLAMPIFYDNISVT
jgi:hypothetical protein